MNVLGCQGFTDMSSISSCIFQWVPQALFMFAGTLLVLPIFVVGTAETTVWGLRAMGLLAEGGEVVWRRSGLEEGKWLRGDRSGKEEGGMERFGEKDIIVMKEAAVINQGRQLQEGIFGKEKAKEVSIAQKDASGIELGIRDENERGLAEREYVTMSGAYGAGSSNGDRSPQGGQSSPIMSPLKLLFPLKTIKLKIQTGIMGNPFADPVGEEEGRDGKSHRSISTPIIGFDTTSFDLDVGPRLPRRPIPAGTFDFQGRGNINANQGLRLKIQIPNGVVDAAGKQLTVSDIWESNERTHIDYGSQFAEYIFMNVRGIITNGKEAAPLPCMGTASVKPGSSFEAMLPYLQKKIHQEESVKVR